MAYKPDEMNRYDLICIVLSMELLQFYYSPFRASAAFLRRGPCRLSGVGTEEFIRILGSHESLVSRRFLYNGAISTY